MDRFGLSAVKKLLALLTLAGSAWGQAEPEEPPQPVLGTFKGTRLYNFHTTEIPAKKHLEFRVAHRFGDLRQGYANFFGIDAGAQVRISLGYAPLSRAEVGIERTGAGKWWNAYIKAQPLRQSAPKGSPISVTWVSMAFFTESSDPVRYRVFSDRLEYFHQVLIARKFSSRLSAMVGGAWLHQNMALTDKALNDWFWILLGGRFKLSQRIVLAGEMGLPLWDEALEEDDESPLPGYRLPWSVFLEIDTGGHVFQIGMTSMDGMSENRALLTQRPLLRLGFNISRIFSFAGGPVYGTQE